MPPPSRRRRARGRVAGAAEDLGRAVEEVRDDLVDATAGKLVEAVGGPARTRVVVLLACVLALASADLATIGAVAKELQTSLDIDNTEVGLLASATLIVGAVATIPIGALTDRTNRTRLLALSVLGWAAAMIASGLALDYPMLLFSRLALGAVTATAGPTLASLVGDLFPARERGRVYGFILAGDLVGLAFGFVVSGALAGLFGWRAAFLVLALPALALAPAIRRLLPEPARGGHSRLEVGAKRIRGVREVEAAVGRQEAAKPRREAGSESMVARAVSHRDDITPRPSLVLRGDPSRMPLWRAILYALRVPTNLVLIVASALGYFYLSGLRTFAIVFVRDRFDLGQTAATSMVLVLGIGAIAGVLVSGRFADRLVARGRLDGRVIVATSCLLTAAAVWIPGLLAPSLVVAIPLYVVASAALAGANPPLDAARLDVMHPRLWGRAESVRTLVRSTFEAAAPVVFGIMADHLGGRGRSNGSFSLWMFRIAAGPAAGLEVTFLVLLVTLIGGGLLLWIAVGTYPRDVATAARSESLDRGRRERAEKRLSGRRRTAPGRRRRSTAPR